MIKFKIDYVYKDIGDDVIFYVKMIEHPREDDYPVFVSYLTGPCETKIIKLPFKETHSDEWWLQEVETNICEELGHKSDFPEFFI